jgi:cytochrome c2/cytochrome c5
VSAPAALRRAFRLVRDRALASFAAALLLACSRDSVPRSPHPVTPAHAAAPAASTPAAATPPSAEALLAHFECNRCHQGTALGPAAHDRDCVQCHREIRAGTFDAPRAALTRWRTHVRSLLIAPSLEASGARLRRAWVADFLQRPHDVRPYLPATMPRLALDSAQAAVLAEQLVPSEQLELDLSGTDRDRGAKLYVELRCARCHRFTGAALPPAHAGPAELGVGRRELDADAIALAPDLALTRARVQPGRLIAWLLDPEALAPGTLMPPHGLDLARARDLAAFLLAAPLPAPASAPPRPRLAQLARDVRWDEVSTRVFRKVCWHCHSAPHFARGDGGPGNTGGFGFSARGLDLSSYEGLASGSLGDDGQRRSVFAPLPDGTPRLLAHLLARASEESGTPVEGLRGMPLGFPALPPVDIQLVETWIAQGRPR